MGGGHAKAFLQLSGRSILLHTLDRFTDPRITAIRVALPKEMLASREFEHTDVRVRAISGGKERSDSVRLGIAALPDDIDVVLIHDAARPLASAGLITRVIDAVTPDAGAIAALPAADTIHVVNSDEFITRTPDRKSLWYAQTPQAFPRQMIVAAHAAAEREKVSLTDDAALVVRYGGRVRVIPGETSNIKITVPADLEIAAALLARPAQ
jgi:2-C-methyl-D-erythritol 4-phosphate cytidylyltransferase